MFVAYDAPGLVGIRYDLEQEPGALLVDRHVAELVDDREPRPGDLPELRIEPVLPFRVAQPHEQLGRVEEPDRYRAHAREPAQRDRGRAADNRPGIAGTSRAWSALSVVRSVFCGSIRNRAHTRGTLWSNLVPWSSRFGAVPSFPA